MSRIMGTAELDSTAALAEPPVNKRPHPTVDQIAARAYEIYRFPASWVIHPPIDLIHDLFGKPAVRVRARPDEQVVTRVDHRLGGIPVVDPFQYLVDVGKIRLD